MKFKVKERFWVFDIHVLIGVLALLIGAYLSMKARKEAKCIARGTAAIMAELMEIKDHMGMPPDVLAVDRQAAAACLEDDHGAPVAADTLARLRTRTDGHEDDFGT